MEMEMRPRKLREYGLRGSKALDRSGKRKGRRTRVDSYLPKRPYSEGRVRPWEL